MRKLIGFELGICLFITIFITGSLFFTSTPIASDNDIDDIKIKDTPQGAYEEVDPISIDGNAAFDTFNDTHDFCTGEGTWDNPYVIEGIYIDADDEDHCLYIKNVHRNITIKNCYFKDSADTKAGIYLQRIQNCTIYNNTIKSNGYGIYLNNCTKNTITLNLFLKNKIAIKIIKGSDTKISRYNDIYLNFFLYTSLSPIQDLAGGNNLDNGTHGNYWSNLNRKFVNKLTNFTLLLSTEVDDVLFKQNVTFHCPDDHNENNYTISEGLELVDKYPLSVNDTDNDGLDDLLEALYWGTDLNNEDTDDDTMPDGWEAKNDLDPLDDGDKEEDADDDDIKNYKEYKETYVNDLKEKKRTDPQDADSDNDGWNDGEEVDEKTSPTNPFDHPDTEDAETFLIPFGFGYLIFFAIGTFSLILYNKKRTIISK